MRKTVKAIVELTMEVPEDSTEVPGNRHFAADLRDRAFELMAEQYPFQTVQMNVAPAEEDPNPDVDAIAGRITLDGRTSQFTIQKGYGWQQWGESREVLSQRVAVVEAMVQGLADDEQFREDEDAEEGEEGIPPL